MIYSDFSIGGKQKAETEAYMNILQKLIPESPDSQSNVEQKRTRSNGNRNRHHNRRSTVTIAYDVPNQFPELSKATTATPSHSISTSLTEAPADASRGKDTYASRTTASTSTTKGNNSKTNNTTTKTVTGKHHREHATLEHHSSEGNGESPQRIASNDARMTAIESRLERVENQMNQQSASTDRSIQELSVLIATLTTNMATQRTTDMNELRALVRLNPTPSSETTVTTVAEIPNKRRPESSPSPNGVTTHQTKRISRPEPTQLDEAFAIDRLTKQ
jgi:hypothetical protein